MKKWIKWVSAVLLAAIIFVYGFCFTVREGSYAIVSRFGEARSRMGDHAAGDRLCPEFPTGQRLDMTGSLPRRRRRKLSRNPGTETNRKNYCIILI